MPTLSPVAAWAARMACRFPGNERGSLLIWFAFALIPLLYAVGAGLDYGRGLSLRTQMQNAADAAALAGATAYTSSSTSATATAAATAYMAAFVARMSSGAGITYAVSTAATASGTSYTLYSVTVTSSATVSSSIMKLGTTASTTVAVTSTAQNPVYTMTLTITGTASSASDADALYYYIVPSDNSVPATSALTQFYSNTSSSTTKSFTVQLTGSQKIGFALYNVTGGRSSYGSNGHGAASGSKHWFYSHLSPPNSVAYPSITKDCSLEVTTSTGAFTSGSCFSTQQTYAALNCSLAPGKTIYYWWNDMGGSTDDYDFNDMSYNVTCSKNSSAASNAVVLVN